MSSATRWWLRDDLAVAYEPNRRVPQPGDLLVGIGDSSTETGLTINHKLARGANDLRFSSLSEYVACADADTVKGWCTVLPDGMSSVRRLIVEDASLDTCFALLVFACRVEPVAQQRADGSGPGAMQALVNAGNDAALDPWLRYVTAWEGGRYLDTPGKPRNSVACLMAVLSHALLSADGAGATPTAQSVDYALRACLNLLDAFLARNAEPLDAMLDAEVAEYVQADKHMTFELQKYDAVLRGAISTQFLIPLVGSKRCVVVDALIVTDVELSGILKVLAHGDASSPTGNGYGVLAMHRPALRGKGNDMTVSVDPGQGVNLELLWDRLEALERERWGAERPNATPRRGIAKYTAPDGQPTTDAPEQPWYDEQGRYTLVCAPFRLQDGRLGSRLEWEADVLPALWSAYLPFQPRDFDFEPSKLSGGRRIVKLKWRGAEPPVAADMPVLNQWLASLSDVRDVQHPGDLVAVADLQAVPLPGGRLVVHEQGMTIFDDWTRASCDIKGAEALAFAMAEVAEGYRAVLTSEDFDRTMAEAAGLAASGQALSFRRVARLRQATLALRARMLGLARLEASVQPFIGQTQAREAIEALWKMPQARSEVWEMITRAEELVTRAHELQQARRGFWTAALLSTAALFVAVQEALMAVKDWATMNTFETVMPLWRTLGVDVASPEDYKELMRNAGLENQFNLTSLIILGLVFAVGMIWALHSYWGVGGKSGADR